MPANPVLPALDAVPASPVYLPPLVDAPLSVEKSSRILMPADHVEKVGDQPVIIQVQDAEKKGANAEARDVKDTKKETLKETQKEAPKLPPPPLIAAPEPQPIEAPLAAECTTCGGDRRHGGCSSCGPYNGIFGCSSCTGGGPCYAGRTGCCYDCERHGPVSRFLCCFYECLCCPDPCYEPRWIPEANAAFFVDGARPSTQTRYRWDAGMNHFHPDIAEMFFARVQEKGPNVRRASVDYHEFTIYQEVAAGKGSFFIEQPYRTVNLNPKDPAAAGAQRHEAGFADLNLGTKSLVFDCDLMQIAFQFRTYILTGVPSKGLGTGHVSLEPSLLFTVKLGCETYFQAQASEWIPLGGTAEHQGSTFHYHLAVNHVLGRCLPNVPVIGTVEMNGYHFQAGQFTEFAADGVTVLDRKQFLASHVSYYNVGAGIRVSVCDRIDFGMAAVFGLRDFGPQQLYRSEIRIRF